MKLKSALTLLFLMLGSVAHAKSVYVTDNIEFSLRANEDSHSRVLGTATSGTELTFISQKKNSEFTKVRMENGQYAFIESMYLLEEPTGRVQLEKANAELTKLRQDNSTMQAELNNLKGNSSNIQSSNENLTKERDKLTNDLNELRYISANAIKIKEQRDKLQEDFVKLNKELEQLKLEKKTLETSANQDWFLYGGILALLGVILGFILPKLSWRRRSHSWDSSF